MRITLEATYQDEAEKLLGGHRLEFVDTRTADREALRAAAEEADVLVLRWSPAYDLDAEFFAGCRRLQLVHKSGSGLERQQAIDVRALTTLGVAFSTNAGINADAVAEHALLLTLLALRPDTVRQVQEMRQGVWDQVPPEGTPRAEILAEKTVGIIGLGRIGCNVAARFRALGVRRLLGYQRRPRFEASVFAEVEWVALAELMRESEVIVMCLPINPTTTGLVGRAELDLVRPSAILVNVGRGGVVDEDALHDALVEGRLRAAGLDVLADEPAGTQSPELSAKRLLALPTVIATPHMAGTAMQVQQRQLTASVQTVADFIRGGRPDGLFNPEVAASPALRATWLKGA